MKTGRIYHYDIVKCIASYLICLFHFGTVETNILQNPSLHVYFNYFILGLASMGVPIFLMANGSLLFIKDYPLSKILQRAVNFGLLFITWGAITLLVTAPLYNDHYSSIQFIQGLFTTVRSRTEHLWFMVAMIYIYLLIPLFKAVLDKQQPVYTKYLFALFFLCTFGFEFVNDVASIAGYLGNSNTLKSFDLQTYLWFNPFSFPFAFTLVYFILGGLLARYQASINVKSISLSMALLAASILLFLFGVLKTLLAGVEYDPVWSNHDTILTLIMAGSLFILCTKITLYKPGLINLTRVIGVNTLGIYFIHVPLGHWLTPLYKKFEISNYLLGDIFYALLLLSVCLAISMFLREIPLVKKLVKIA